MAHVRRMMMDAKMGVVNGGIQYYDTDGDGWAVPAASAETALNKLDIIETEIETSTRFVRPTNTSTAARFMPPPTSTSTRFVAPLVTPTRFTPPELTQSQFADLVAHKVLAAMHPEGRTSLSKDAIFDRAKEPTSVPPFLLPQEKGDEDAYANYLLQLGDKKEVLYLRKDDQNFTKIVAAVKLVNTKISDFNRDSTRRYSEILYNTVVQFGDFVIDVLGDVAKFVARGSLNEPITKVRDIIKRMKPSEKVDYVGVLNAIKSALFEGHPGWKHKFNEIAEASFIEMISDMGGGGESQGQGRPRTREEAAAQGLI